MVDAQVASTIDWPQSPNHVLNSGGNLFNFQTFQSNHNAFIAVSDIFLDSRNLKLLCFQSSEWDIALV